MQAMLKAVAMAGVGMNGLYLGAGEGCKRLKE